MNKIRIVIVAAIAVLCLSRLAFSAHARSASNPVAAALPATVASSTDLQSMPVRGAWAYVDEGGNLLDSSANIQSVVKTGTGGYSITFAPGFGDDRFAAVASAERGFCLVENGPLGTGLRVEIYDRLNTQDVIDSAFSLIVLDQ